MSPDMCRLRLDIAPSTLLSIAKIRMGACTRIYRPRVPKFLGVMLDPESERLEPSQETDVLAERVGLSLNSEGRYSVGLWDNVMSSGCIRRA